VDFTCTSISAARQHFYSARNGSISFKNETKKLPAQEAGGLYKGNPRCGGVVSIHAEIRSDVTNGYVVNFEARGYDPT
jgi:hypothetical protein